MTDNRLKLEVTTIPRVSEFEHLRELKIVSCAKCGEVYPQQVSDRKSGEIRESDIRGFAHTCES